jgi:predicted RNA-binding Zn-ribbon protein involved in translation (DUF1610 family)
MFPMIDDRICHVYMKYTGRPAGTGVMVEEETEKDKIDLIEVCGERLRQWRKTEMFYCPNCDQLDSMIPR